jgi:hypothetical protein
MNRYKVTMNAVLTFEVDAPNEAAAKGAIYQAFKSDAPHDPLAGARFGFAGTERQCANPQLMTAVAPGMRDIEAELA